MDFGLDEIKQQVATAADKVKEEVKHEVLVAVHKVLLRNELAALIELEPTNTVWQEMIKEAGAQ